MADRDSYAPWVTSGGLRENGRSLRWWKSGCKMVLETGGCAHGRSQSYSEQPILVDLIAWLHEKQVCIPEIR